MSVVTPDFTITLFSLALSHFICKLAFLSFFHKRQICYFHCGICKYWIFGASPSKPHIEDTARNLSACLYMYVISN